MKTINVMRSMAIFFVICAHVNNYSEKASDAVQACSLVLQCVMLPGVFIFFFLAGYCLGYNKRCLSAYMTHKLQTIVFPWFVTGTLVFLWVYLRKHSISFQMISEYMTFILGFRTYLWYMTVLMLLYFVFFLATNWCVRLLLLTFSCLSFVFVSKWQPYVWNWGGDYLNIMNYYPFFIMGFIVHCLFNKNVYANILVRRVKTYLLKNSKWLAFICGSISIWMIYFILYKQVQMSYWNYKILPFVMTVLLAVCFFSYILKDSKMLNDIGKHSFSIYLLHMPVAGIVVNVCNRVDSALLMLLRPFIVLVVVVCFLKLFEKAIHGMKHELLLKSAIGIR